MSAAGPDRWDRRPAGRVRTLLAHLVPPLLIVVAACSAPAAPPGPPSGAVRPPAAEPAPAPAPQRPPDGRVVAVGAGAEGIVADAASGMVAVAVRAPSRLVLLDARSAAVRGQSPRAPTSAAACCSCCTRRSRP